MIIVLLADGFEEIEALTPVDMLRRAGVTVKTVGIGGKIAVGSHGIAVVTDLLPDEVNLNDVSTVIFPGGMPGALNLDASPFTDKVIEEMTKKGGRLAAICAAPLILGRRGLLEGKRATCYPGFESELKGAVTVDEGVVTDGFITTAQGMGVSLAFAKELISLIVSKEKADELSAAIMERPAAEYSEVEEEWFEDEDEPCNSHNEADKADSDTTEQDIINECVSFNTKDYSDYEMPSAELLKDADECCYFPTDAEIKKTSEAIVDICKDFNVKISVANVEKGPRITRYEVVPEKGVKVSSVINLLDDITLGLAEEGVRIEAPIPGKARLGIEVPNHSFSPVRIKELIESDEYINSESPTTVCLGKDVTGKNVIYDIIKMPHLLIAGATGMGKSVCINSLIADILYKARPDEVKLIMIDTKMVEFTMYNGIPHLLTPIIFDQVQAVGALMWAVEEMERRYDILNAAALRNIDAYNEKAKADTTVGEPLPKIVIVIDEFADLMMQVRDPVESLVMRIAQKSRAAGIHLIIGTQRPAVNVITGTIKANIPSRISFKVISHTDSRTILDVGGAEKLLGKGDMLFSFAGAIKPIRVQGSFISDTELCAVTDHLKKFGGKDCYNAVVTKKIDAYAKEFANQRASAVEDSVSSEENYLVNRQFLDAVELAIDAGRISTSLIQRKLSIGYGKAAKFLDVMESMGVVGEGNGPKPREVLITAEEWKKKLSKSKSSF